MHTDNQALKFLMNKVGGGKVRHVQGRCLWLQQFIGRGEIAVKKVATRNNAAEIGAKNLNKRQFMKFLRMLGFVDTCSFEPVGQAELKASEMTLRFVLQAFQGSCV